MAEARLALEIAHEANAPGVEVEARVILARVQGRLDDWPAAAETLDGAVTLVHRHARDNPDERVRILLQAAVVDRLARLEVRANTRIEQARQIAERANSDDLRKAVAEV